MAKLHNFHGIFNYSEMKHAGLKYGISSMRIPEGYFVTLGKGNNLCDQMTIDGPIDFTFTSSKEDHDWIGNLDTFEYRPLSELKVVAKWVLVAYSEKGIPSLKTHLGWTSNISQDLELSFHHAAHIGYEFQSQGKFWRLGVNESMKILDYSQSLFLLPKIHDIEVKCVSDYDS